LLETPVKLRLPTCYRDPAHFDLYCAARGDDRTGNERLLTWRDQHVSYGLYGLIGRGSAGHAGKPLSKQLGESCATRKAFPALWEVRNELSPAPSTMRVKWPGGPRSGLIFRASPE